MINDATTFKLILVYGFTTTLIIADGTKVEHRAVRQLVKTHFDKFKCIGERTFQMSFLKKKNKPIACFNLNDVQATFLVTLMRNSDIVVKFKLDLAIEFKRMEMELARIASNQNNEQWIEQRNAGKIARIIETDVIQRFIEYAKQQGGSEEGCDRYYSNLSKMENKALFVVERKYPNLRNVLGVTDLSTIQKADVIVSRALNDGMADKKQYKDIYKMAKERVEMFAKLIGKTPIALI